MPVAQELERWVARGSRSRPLSLRQAERLVRDECVTAAGGTALPVPMTSSQAFGPGLDWDRLCAALASVCEEHWPLRSVFPRLPDSRRGLRALDNSKLACDYAVFDGEAPARSWLDARQAEPLDLLCGPLLRCEGARVEPTSETWVQLTVEHMIFDGLSEAVLMDRLRDAYNGLGVQPAGPAYETFVARQWDLVDSEEGRRRLAFWRSRLPEGQVRPGFSLTPAYSPEEPSCGWLHADLPQSTADDLARAARAFRTTVFSLIAAAVLLAMRGYAADGPLGFACPVANRSTREERQAIGNFSDYMVIRTERAGRELSPVDAVVLARQAVAEGLANHYPWSTLVRTLEPDSFIRPDPRPHLSVNYLGTADDLRDYRLEGVKGARIREDAASAQRPPHPLTLSFRQAGGLRIDLGYRGLADPAPAVSFLSDCTAALRRVVAAAAAG